MNEANGVGNVVARLIELAEWQEVIVVDDGSTDATADRARSAGARVIRHPYTKGNGAAIKTGVRNATGDFILIIDADGQHPPEEACRLVKLLGDFDLVVGARRPASHTSLTRRWGNAVLNGLASYVTEMRIPDLTSGFRAARRSLIQEMQHLLPNGFSTPTTTTLAFIKVGHNVKFEPFDGRPDSGTSKVRLARDGTRFFFILLRLCLIYSPLRIFVPVSAGAFAVGAIYAAFSVAAGGRIPNGAMLLILFSVLAFLVGLVSDQIASLRLGGVGRL